MAELWGTLDSYLQRHGLAPTQAGEMKRVLLVVDMQRDFMPGGSLPVPEADRLVPVINNMMRNAGRREHFDACLATKDWHPPDHFSFAQQHEGAHVGDYKPTPSRKHMVQLFNPHCVAGTPGAEFAEGLETQHILRTFLKGQDASRESYSGFYDMAHKHSTGLAEFLRAQGTEAVCVVGVALDYCVRATVLDSLAEGFETYVVVDGVSAVDEEAGQHVLEELRREGAKLVYLRAPVSPEPAAGKGLPCNLPDRSSGSRCLRLCNEGTAAPSSLRGNAVLPSQGARPPHSHCCEP